MSAPRLKVCGLTRWEDAVLAADLGAWALGFVFYEKSPRSVSPGHAGSIVAKLSRPGLKTVGVFVNADLETIRKAVARSGVNTVQLHGDETPDFCGRVSALLPAIQVIKALRPRSGRALETQADLASLADYASICEAVLLDAHVPGNPGGTGVIGDWAQAERAGKTASVILAGGLNPENIAAALATVRPFAADASSGLESMPGVKSSEKLRAFFRNAAEWENSK